MAVSVGNAAGARRPRRRLAVHPGAVPQQGVNAPALRPNGIQMRPQPPAHRGKIFDERTPRPLGVAPGIPYRPRKDSRNAAEHSLETRAVELFEDHPELPNLLRIAKKVWAELFVQDHGRPGTDVPDEPGSFKVAAIGDFGAGTPQLERVAATIRATRPDFVITTGDNVYPSGRWEDYRKNFDPPKYFGNIMREYPVMPSVGNHDLYHDDLRPYFWRFPHLKGQPYYAFTKKNAHFVVLDSNADLRVGSPQRLWLENELRSSTKKWKIVYLHHPLLSSNVHTGNEEVNQSLAPLFKKYGVQLVLAGHEHAYERTVPLQGTTYVVTGGGGQIVYDYTKQRPQWSAFRAAKYHHVQLSVGATRLVVRAIDEHGKVFDAFSIPGTGRDQAVAGAAMVSQS